MTAVYIISVLLGFFATAGIWSIAGALDKIHGELVRIGGSATPFLEALNRIPRAINALEKPPVASEPIAQTAYPSLE